MLEFDNDSISPSAVGLAPHGLASFSGYAMQRQQDIQTWLAGFAHPLPWGLAGGLSLENIGEAIRITGAPLVYTSSGVESGPGIKDVDKIAAFLKAATNL